MYNIEEKMQALKRLQEALDACRKAGIEFNTDMSKPKQASSPAPMPAPPKVQAQKVERAAGKRHINIERIIRALAVKGKISVALIRKEAKRLGFNTWSVGQSLRHLEEAGTIARDGDTVTLL